MKNLLIC